MTNKASVIFQINSRQRIFLFNAAACFFGLLAGGFALAPTASMQDDDRAPVVVTTNSMRAMANYQPTPAPPKTTLRGRVFYADTARAVKRASVMLMPEDLGSGPNQAPSSLTDADGNFTMRDVAAGTYYAIINAPGVYTPLAFYDFSVSSGRGGGADREAMRRAFAGFEPIYVDGVSESFVQIPARRGGAIGGRVVYDDGDAAIGVKVEVLRKAEGGKFVSSIPNLNSMVSMRFGTGTFQTDDRGAYRFAGLPPGEYVVRVSEAVTHGENADRSGYDPFAGGFIGKSFLTVFYQDAEDAQAAQTIKVGAGEEVSEINLTLPSRQLFRVEGRVVARQSKTPLRARIGISKTKREEVFSIFDDLGGGDRRQTAATEADGSWRFKELPKGKYTLTIEPVEDEPDHHSYSMNSANRPAAAPKPKFAKRAFEITIDDRDLSEIVVELGYGATVSGKVTTENSREMPNYVTVTARQTDGELAASGTISNYSDPNNPSPPSHDFKIEGASEGKTEFQITVSDDNFYVKSATLGGTDLFAGTIDLKEGDHLRNAQIVLSKAVGILKGVVFDASKAPAKKARFTLVPADAARRKNPAFTRRVTANENGEFETKLPPFEYAILFDDDSAQPAAGGEAFDRWFEQAIKDARKVAVKSNETEKISLTLP